MRLPEAPSAPEVAIIIVNWNGWRDTLECLESVFRLDYPEYRVVVCDNGSQDRSFEYLEAWADGRLDVALALDNPLRPLSFPPVRKPRPYRTYRGAPAGGQHAAADARLIVVQTGANRGFAGGVNVGIAYALAQREIGYVWLLNNDTVVHPAALACLVRRMQERPDAGMCGSTVRYYHAPMTIQALGGARYNRWLGATWHIGLGQAGGRAIDIDRVERRLAYILGASMLVSRSFLEDVGPMSEDYFLFFEELDWAIRGHRRWALAYAPDSLVYHKEGAGSGASWDIYRRSPVAECLHVRNRLRLTRKFYPLALPTVYLGIVMSMLKRIREGQWDKAKMIAGVAFGRGRSIAGRPEPGTCRGACP
jgi:GT2 family glycosyltransferase